MAIVDHGFRLLNSEVRNLTPAFVEEFRELEPSPTEREINPRRIKFLKDRAENGLLVTFHWSVAQLNKRKLRMNGQHSSTMLAGLNGGFPDGLKVHLDEYEVDNPEALALLFRQFDARQSSRTPADVAGAYQMLYPELEHIAKPIAKLGIEGIAWHNRVIEGIPTPSGDDVFQLFNHSNLYPFLNWIDGIFSVKTPEMRRVQVVSAMYATSLRNQTESAFFWELVARGGKEFEEQHPTTVLDNWLKLAKEGEMKTPLKPAEMYQGCIYAWNAFREEKPIKDIRYDTKKSWYVPSE